MEHVCGCVRKKKEVMVVQKPAAKQREVVAGWKMNKTGTKMTADRQQ